MVWVQAEASGAKPARFIPLDADPTGTSPLPATGRHANVVLTGETVPSGAEDKPPLAVVRHTLAGKGDFACHWATCPERQDKPARPVTAPRKVPAR